MGPNYNSPDMTYDAIAMFAITLFNNGSASFMDTARSDKV
jgi:hypothetical protein